MIHYLLLHDNLLNGRYKVRFRRQKKSTNDRMYVLSLAVALFPRWLAGWILSAYMHGWRTLLLLFVLLLRRRQEERRR